MNYDLIIARYGEIGLKSPKVRKRFENRLIHNIQASIDAEIKIDQARIFIKTTNFKDTQDKLKRIFGIVSFSPAVETETNKDTITETLSNYVDKLKKQNLIKKETKFAIRCRRVGQHNFTSQEIAAYAGSVVVKKLGCPVDLTNPELEIFLEVRDNKTYIYHEKIEGAGGLPLGTQGKVIVLTSSGIDSPVAAYLMMKRGCQVISLYCNNIPYTTEQALKNNEDIVNQLQKYASGAPIKRRVVQYGEYLSKCKKDAHERMTCILCKSGMYQLASKLAKDMNALAIVDGSSLGQVASQTLPNILASREKVDVPILSPLIGLDKIEITRMAEKIGTFEISKRDDGGCKAVPKYPETNADINLVHEAKKTINQEEEIQKAYKTIKF